MSKLSSYAQTLDALARLNLGMAAGKGAAFFAVLDTRMGAAPWLLALVTAAPYLANLFAPAWVGQSQRWGIRLLVVASLVASAGVLFLLSVAQTPAVFALLVVLYYLFYGVSDPLYVALAELVYPERTGTKLGRAQALFNAAHIGAALLAVNSAALIVVSWGWGALAEQLKRLLPLFYLALAAMIGMALLYAFGRSFGLLLIANILCGIGGRAIAIAWRLFTMQIEAYRTDDLAGLHLLTCGLRGLYAPALGVLLVSFWNPTGAMLVAAGMLALGGLVLLPLKETASTSLAPEILPSLSEQEREP